MLAIVEGNLSIYNELGVRGFWPLHRALAALEAISLRCRFGCIKMNSFVAGYFVGLATVGFLVLICLEIHARYSDSIAKSYDEFRNADNQDGNTEHHVSGSN
jgi:hypothetical protein